VSFVRFATVNDPQGRCRLGCSGESSRQVPYHIGAQRSVTYLFVAERTGGVTRVEKYGCGAALRRTLEDHYLMTILPTILVNGQFVRLWGAG
jgi:hypothetical protein